MLVCRNGVILGWSAQQLLFQSNSRTDVPLPPSNEPLVMPHCPLLSLTPDTMSVLPVFVDLLVQSQSVGNPVLPEHFISFHLCSGVLVDSNPPGGFSQQRSSPNTTPEPTGLWDGHSRVGGKSSGPRATSGPSGTSRGCCVWVLMRHGGGCEAQPLSGTGEGASHHSAT